MGRVDEIARRFSIPGVLDEGARVRERWPVEEVDVASVADHPANSAYSMDEDAISALAESIRKDGLTDIPLARRLADGGLQMISGHRRKAAYALLAKDDPAFSKMPCRIVDGVGDEESVTLLHTANYFTRELNVVERAKATQALGVQVRRMREADPGLKGVRSADLKAAIIRSQTGRSVSPATIKRQEQTARKVETELVDAWREEALAGTLTDSDIAALAEMPAEEQRGLHARKTAAGAGRAQTSKLIREARKRDSDKVGEHLRKALKHVDAALREVGEGGRADPADLGKLEASLRGLRDAASSK